MKENKESISLGQEYYLDALFLLFSYVTVGYYFNIIEPCTSDNEDQCMREFNFAFTKYLFFGALFASCHLTQFIRGLKNQNLFNIVYSITVFLYMTSLRPGFDFTNHGTYAKITCYLALIFILWIFTLYKIVNFFKRKYKYFTIIMLIISLLLIFVSHYLILNSKKYFNRGFNNQWLQPNINNISAECDLKEYYFPSYDLGYKIMIPIQSFINEDCQTMLKKEFHQFYNKSLNQNIEKANYQVYPSFYNINLSKNSYDLAFVLQNISLENIKFYENKSEFSEDYWINFENKSNPYLEVDFKERLVPFKIENTNKFSVISILFDATSRQQFFRSYPKTAEYLQKFYDPNNDLKSKGFQFFRTQSYEGYTQPNERRYRFGDKNGNPLSIEHIAKNEGYVTNFFSAECGYYYTSYVLKPRKNRHNNEDMIQCHHDNVALACDQINYPYKDPQSHFKGPNSLVQRCFLGENLSKYSYDFLLDFHQKYKQYPKYSYVQLMDAHEPSSIVW